MKRRGREDGKEGADGPSRDIVRRGEVAVFFLLGGMLTVAKRLAAVCRSKHRLSLFVFLVCAYDREGSGREGS